MTIILHSATFIFSQECDCNDDDLQELRVSIEEGGGGPFITISTRRWAFDSGSELSSLLHKIEFTCKPLFALFAEKDRNDL